MMSRYDLQMVDILSSKLPKVHGKYRFPIAEAIRSQELSQVVPRNGRLDLDG